ncbi:GAF domain-containing protein [Loktanella sp. F6476L]|uniref:HWE histidine kinase domain-containing protein n=1 Tax=Loktanella sp. F6476L TaxID=2926405 RepID=UPI001FF28257|nr:HWE histidine kinase domain-containing protein [Loktanella sp. F6476L]MCK0119020.1 GAF domain-containing protein [Loktanella sp. F6476L]
MTDESLQLDPNETVDLTNCDREPIQFLGNVQSYGCLIATSSDFMVKHVSANVQELLNIDPDAAIGGRLNDLLSQRMVHDLRTKLQMLNATMPTARVFGYDVLENGTYFDISISAVDQSYVFEFEPKVALETRDEMSLVQPLVARVTRAPDVMKACEQAAVAVQALSGFDRVMVYKFDDDGAGEVIAEKRRAHMKPFLGLRYPASDIPKQARALYLRSPLRLISDVDGAVSPILPATNVHGKPLDLSLCVTRAVSPIHLEYLRNMGVGASMSISIIKDGKLWGLFACHHEAARYVDFERRTAIELFTQFFTYELIQKMELETRLKTQETRQMHDNLMVQISGGADLIEGFDSIVGELSGLIANDGVAVYTDGRFASHGDTPDEASFRKLVRFLNTAPSGQVFSTHALPAVYPAIEDQDADVAGVLAVPISRTPRDYIVFFRREIVKSVKWAGDPNKPVTVGPNGTRLTPRKSFDTWSEMVRNTSARWSEGEQMVAEGLRISLTEIVLKLTDEANETRRKAADKQELLVAELNHRVRNILNLIQGLVAQSRSGASDVATYTKVLDGRVHALARAHDQLTNQEWSPSSLRQLINVEGQAFLLNGNDRVKITGDAPMLMPEAFSTLALVIHEMMTNSAKYGALTDRSGAVSIDLKVQADGALIIQWRDVGGPPVQAPLRRGFGSTIIEKTIPYELKGKVETRFLLTGFEADLTIPSRFISNEKEPVLPTTQSNDAKPMTPDVLLSGEVLVVEDNMVIALDASDIISDCGADHVHMAGSVDDALAILEKADVSFALLDVNLGDQTSLPIAAVLAERGIPFVLATGYGDAQSITANYPPTHVVKKPFTAEKLRDAVFRAVN